MSPSVLRRVVRRETHSPRTVATVIVLVLVALTAVAAGVEIVLHLLGVAPLLVAPGAVLAWAAALPEAVPQASVVAGGAAVTAIGIILVWLALSPGRRPRHELGTASHAVLVDNGVIASSLAEQVRRALDLPRGAVVVGVGHTSADVTVRPEPGQTVAKSHARSVAETELASYDLSPRVRVRVRVLRPTAAERGA